MVKRLRLFWKGTKGAKKGRKGQKGAGVKNSPFARATKIITNY